MPKSIYFLLIFLSFGRLWSQTNILTNGDFETYSSCPNSPGVFSVCTGWNNVNLNYGSGLWGTPDYFNTCGSSGYAPPATFSGTCSVHGGNAMAGIVVYNTPYPDYREYISRQLPTPMLPGNTYTFSFWITNGTGIKSPWAIKNIGACFSPSVLSQSGYAVISATPQCEVTSVIASTVWTQYSFTVAPTATWNYITFGAFRTDALNTPTMVFPNPGGAPSVYANYFIDDLEIWFNNCTPPPLSLSASSTTICGSGSSATLNASGASSYTWSPSGSLSSSTGTSVVANPSVTTIYTVTASNGSCSATSTLMLGVLHTNITITPSTASVCSGAVLSLTANGASSYTWQPGNLFGTTVSYTPSSNTNYSVAGISPAGCFGSTVISVPLIQPPSLTVSPSATVCQGASAVFSAASVPASSTYWLPYSSTTSLPNYSFNTNTPGLSTFTVVAQSANGCTTSVNRTLLVNANPVLSVSPISQNVCAGTSATFSALGAAQYSWFPGSTTGSVISIPSVSTNLSYTLIGQSLQGCTATALAQLVVIPSPTVTSNANPTSACMGQTSTLTCFGASNYTWLPGNASGSVIVVSPLASTIYTVIGELNGCKDSSFVMVSNPVNPVILSSGEISCTQPTLQLQAISGSSSNIISWSGPGVNGLSSPIVYVTSAGVYSVHVSDPLNLCSGIATIQVINSIGTLSPNIVASTTLACFPGPAVNLLVSAPGSYTWLPQSSVSPSTGPLVSVSPSVTSSFTLEAEQGICTGSAVVTISVVPVPVVVLSSKTETLCAGKAIRLSATGANNYIWQPGALSGDTVMLEPLSTSIYTVMGYVSSCYSTQELTVTVLPSPQLTVSTSAPILCVGNSATLSAISTDSVSWFINGSAVSNNSVIVTPFGNSTYTAIAKNSMGCTTDATIAVSAISIATITAESSDTLICEGAGVTLSATGSDNYTWTPGGLTGSQITFSPSSSTNYTVYTAVSGCGSFTTINVSVMNCGNRSFGVTNAASKPELYNGSLYKINFTVTAVNNSNEDLKTVYLWDELEKTFVSPSTFTLNSYVTINPKSSKLIANGFFDGQTQRSLTVGEKSQLGANSRDTLLFSVLMDPHGFSGTVYNTVFGEALRSDGSLVADSSNNGFLWDPDLDGDPTNNDTLTPIEILPSNLFIPEGFTPDGNGQNDLFVIKGLNGRHVKLEVFNRWGNKVYQHDNYDNSWDGRMNVNSPHFGSGKLPDGTYYYVLQFLDGEKKILHGFVVLKY